MASYRAIFDLRQFVAENLSTIEEMENDRIQYEENGIDKTHEHTIRLRYQNSQHEAQIVSFQKQSVDEE